MCSKKYIVAQHCFEVCSEVLCNAVSKIQGFKPFEVTSGTPEFSFAMGEELPAEYNVQYSFTYEDILGEYGSTENGFFLKQTPANEEPLLLWTSDHNDVVFLAGNLSPRLVRFALWVGYGLKTAASGTIAIHSSCIVADGRAVIFLGESGTGKSTHTRLWRENIPGAVLLNDDSPIVRIFDGSVWVFGSPWSGKTPCYKQERYPLAACVRLSQAPYNAIHKLHVIKGYAALHPSCPPEFAYDERIYSHISAALGTLLKSVPVYHLECLPNAAAAHLSFETVLSR
ncbi:MAG: hypothetical protein J6Q34_09055 [Bacteroidales bacterium]|nr:hypothetical protein [Bacteroidales bacterium]